MVAGQIPASADPSLVGSAYDALASGYDRDLERSGWMRRQLWRRFDRLFEPGTQVIDAGCGTGADTLHLAAHGVRITAIDASAGMIAELRAKAADRAGDNAPVCRVGGINEVLATLAGPFDGIVSSFAALNTVSLDEFAAVAARLVRPGGHVVCHMLSPGYHRGVLGRLLLSMAGRHGSGAVPMPVRLAGQPIEHTNLHPLEIYDRFFAPAFELHERRAMALIVTPGIERRLGGGFLDLLAAADARLGALGPLLPVGRFFLLDLIRRA